MSIFLKFFIWKFDRCSLIDVQKWDWSLIRRKKNPASVSGCFLLYLFGVGTKLRLLFKRLSVSKENECFDKFITFLDGSDLCINYKILRCCLWVFSYLLWSYICINFQLSCFLQNSKQSSVLTNISKWMRNRISSNVFEYKDFTLSISSCAFVYECACNYFLYLFYKSHKGNIDFKDKKETYLTNIAPNNVYFKINKRHTRKRCEICSKLTMKYC